MFDIFLKKIMDKKILEIRKEKQEKIVEKLIDNSRLTLEYDLLLIFSAVITASGILVNNMAVVIGGMLVTPLLVPILTIALGIASGDMKVTNRSLINSAKSILIIIITAILISFFFSNNLTQNIIVTNCLDHHPLYLLVALFSGIAAAFAYISPKISEALPGVAVAVSLMPPLAVFGIGIGQWQLLLIKGSLVTFLLNLIGIIMGSLIVFSLSKFYRVRSIAQREIKKEE
ncbi:MAG: TIGR00341 family protein [Xanthomonadaceae bacterium]|nr:TIGR00341 family protein [Rhodospirillaceae bacterium]NIA17573.1 TIGR00341 family protein [Xanthomonadaceae bacterium]